MQLCLEDAGNFLKIARAWLCICVVSIASFGQELPADEAALQSENDALRAEVARLTALLAETKTGMCRSSDQSLIESSDIQLLRKLARQRTAQAEQTLGFDAGPLIIPDALLGAVVSNEYIILHNSSDVQTATDAAALIGVNEAQITHVYTRALNGFAVRLSDAERVRVEQSNGVIGVVQNGYVFASSFVMPQLKGLPDRDWIKVQNSSENSVDVYLFDTGIRAAHRDLEGRVAQQGFSFFNNGIAGEDCSGHGTHVAARIAGHSLGVSGAARLVSVKVIDRFGTGDVATVIAGIDWVLDQEGPHKLVNMSLTRLVTQSPSVLDMAVDALIAEGATVVIAAGNAAADAQAYSPARVADAITVGSATMDGLSDFSNAGTGVDIYAPGEAISSASIRDVCGVHEMSGTSMAAPFVTGLIANFLAKGIPPEKILARLQATAQRVPTGAFSGEVERYVLSETTQPVLLPCVDID